MTSRRGFTLVELLVVMTAMAAILAASVVLMHFVLQLDSSVRQRTRTITTIGRLAEQFRRDVHQARGEPHIAADHHAVELQVSGGGTIKWRVDESGGLLRTEQAREAIAPPALREDSFPLPKGTTATLELQSQRAARFVSMHVDSPASGGPTLAIEALAARDERLAIEEEKP